MADVPPRTENPSPPTVIDGATGDVLPPGNDIRSEQIKTVAQTIAPLLSEDQKLAVQREALQQGIERRKVDALAAGALDRRSAAITPQEPVPAKPQRSLFKPWTWFK